MKKTLTDFQKKLRLKYQKKYSKYKITQFLRKPYNLWKQIHSDDFDRPRIQNWGQKYYPKKRPLVERLCDVFAWVSFWMCMEHCSLTSPRFPDFPNDKSSLERLMDQSCLSGLGNFEEELQLTTKIVRQVDGSSVSTVDRFQELRLKDHRRPRKTRTNNIKKLQEQLERQKLEKEKNPPVEEKNLDPAIAETIADKKVSPKIPVKKLNGKIVGHTTVEEIKTRTEDAKNKLAQEQEKIRNQVCNLQKLNQKDLDKQFTFTEYEDFLILLYLRKIRGS